MYTLYHIHTPGRVPGSGRAVEEPLWHGGLDKNNMSLQLHRPNMCHWDQYVLQVDVKVCTDGMIGHRSQLGGGLLHSIINKE